MHVVIINESAKKALVRSRRILSKYLPQLGATTWAGRISEEGLADLQQKLKAKASKSTSIACHRVVTRSRMELQWIVGSKDCFADDGRYAFRQSKARPAPGKASTAARGPLHAYTAALLRLAGLLHDTGKSSLAFSKKLYAGSGFEAVRHDLLGFLVLAESLLKPGVTDHSWLTLLAEHPEAACACIDTGANRLLPESSVWLQRVATASHEMDHPLPGGPKVVQHLLNSTELEPLAATAPGLLTVLWLTLTHHRLPDGSEQRIELQAHINRTTRDAAELSAKKGWYVGDLDACLTLAPGEHPWQNPAWLTAVQSAAKAALAALSSVPAQTSKVWSQVMRHRLRPLLMTADQLAAARCDAGPAKTRKPLHVYANTRSEDLFGDTLAEHELKVARTTRQVQALLDAELPSTRLPNNSLAKVPTLPPQFMWQRELELCLGQARLVGPTFVSLIAETGAGKTLGALRAAAALSPAGLRLTVALGLRSLTKQTADAFVQDAKLPARDVMLAVGQPQTLSLMEQVQKAWESPGLVPAAPIKGITGSESTLSLDEDTDVLRVDGELEDRYEWASALGTPDELTTQWGQKTMGMLAAPVLACTADHLVGAATQLSGCSKMFIRAATSDLVLDEIDSYSAKDLQTIAKLAFAFGSYGRNVIVMSATMSPEVQKGLYRAWRSGLAVHAAMLGQTVEHAAVFASNTDGSELLQSPTQEAAAAAWGAFVERVCTSYAARAGHRRKLSLLNLPPVAGALAHEAILDGAVAMHRDHHTVDPATGKRVSVGFVRFNVTKSARDMGAYLARRHPAEGEPDVRFVVYHAKYPRSYLAVLDAVLGAMTNRKTTHDFLATPALRQALDTSDNEDVLVLVCTTTLIETGRDFDFDWAILEPREPRGEVQAAGRVRRHRAGGVDTPNVLVMDKPLKALSPAGLKKPLWGYPGIELSITGLEVTKPLPALCFAGPAPKASPLARKPERVVLAEDALPLAQWRVSFDAQACLRAVGPATHYAANRLGFLAQFVEHANLSLPATERHNKPLPLSVWHYLETMLPLSNLHDKETPFRDSKATCLFRAGERLAFWDTAKETWLPLLAGKSVDCSAARALIPDIEAQAQALEVSDDPYVVGCALPSNLSTASLLELEWSPLLGFQIESR